MRISLLLSICFLCISCTITPLSSRKVSYNSETGLFDELILNNETIEPLSCEKKQEKINRLETFLYNLVEEYIELKRQYYYLKLKMLNYQVESIN